MRLTEAGFAVAIMFSIFINRKLMGVLSGLCYQQQDGEKAVKDVVSVGQVPSPAKGKDLHTHFKQVIEDEAQVDDLKIGQ